MSYTSFRPYPYLPQNKKYLYVPIENMFMQEAMRVRNNYSSVPQYSTGAVIVKNNQIIGRGANQAMFTAKWYQKFHANNFCLRRFLKIKTGQKYWLCPGCAQPNKHAEAMAIKNAKKSNHDLLGSDLYLFGHWWCCKDCWDKMIGAGIKNVYLVEGASEMFK